MQLGAVHEKQLLSGCAFEMNDLSLLDLFTKLRTAIAMGDTRLALDIVNQIELDVPRISIDARQEPKELFDSPIKAYMEHRTMPKVKIQWRNLTYVFESALVVELEIGSEGCRDEKV